MKVMIVEDEEGIRKLLVKIVSKNESFQVVAECAGFHDAIKMYSECQPDIIFMDIEIKENEADEKDFSKENLKRLNITDKIVNDSVENALREIVLRIKSGR